MQPVFPVEDEKRAEALSRYLEDGYAARPMTLKTEVPIRDAYGQAWMVLLGRDYHYVAENPASLEHMPIFAAVMTKAGLLVRQPDGSVRVRTAAEWKDE